MKRPRRIAEAKNSPVRYASSVLYAWFWPLGIQDWRRVTVLDKLKTGEAIGLVPIAFSGRCDDLVVSRLKMPIPLVTVVAKNFIVHGSLLMELRLSLGVRLRLRSERPGSRTSGDEPTRESTGWRMPSHVR